MHVSTAPLGELATEVLGRRTLVHLGHSLPYGVRGLAYMDAAGCPVLELNPTIFETRDVKELGAVFWHEVAHVKLGHVTEARGSSRGTPTAAQLADAVKYSQAAAAGQKEEAEADAWADAARRRYPDRWLWELVTKG